MYHPKKILIASAYRFALYLTHAFTLYFSMKPTFFILFALGLLTAPAAEAQITKERLAEFRELTLQRVNDLQDYLTVIADKKRSLDERTMAVGLANGLFAMPPDEKTVRNPSTTSRATIARSVGSLMLASRLSRSASVRLSL